MLKLITDNYIIEYTGGYMNGSYVEGFTLYTDGEEAHIEYCPEECEVIAHCYENKDVYDKISKKVKALDDELAVVCMNLLNIVDAI